MSKPATAYFDTYGLPHIYADNKIDAQCVLGYVHAQERARQMELLRRIALGSCQKSLGQSWYALFKRFWNKR